MLEHQIDFVTTLYVTTGNFVSCKLYTQAKVNQKLKNMCNTYDCDNKNFNQTHHTIITNSQQAIGNTRSSYLGPFWTRTSLLGLMDQ